MYEVEVKARLKDRQAVMKKLEALGCSFSDELHQIDHIFIPDGIDFPPPLGVPVLRVRKQNGKSFLTLKIPQSSKQDCIEREFEVSDGEGMLDIIRLLGYKKVPTVEKKRIKTNINNIEIVLDVVEKLGEFIEAERITEMHNPEDRIKIQEELFIFLAELGIKQEDHIIDGKYDIMLFDKYGME